MTKNEIAIKINDIHKEFILPQSKHTSVKQAAVNIVRKNGKIKQRALNGVSFDIKKGEFFGIIGRNGSGKSTMLKLLAGVYTPTRGRIDINGGLTPFIELGVGFNPELSGRDNVYLNGALLGFTRAQMDEMYDEIVEFAELAPFMGQKLKNYSSGMQVRLAFSIAIKAKNDILLFDEVLAVGDEKFQRKCIGVFEELKRSGATIVFVSHAMGQVRQFCDRVAVISDGKLAYIGETEAGIDEYHKLNSEDDKESVANRELAKNDGHLGSGGARIESYLYYDVSGNEINQFVSGERFTVTLDILYRTQVKEPSVGVMFRKDPQVNLFGMNNFYEKVSFGVKRAGDRQTVSFTSVMPLTPGTYYVSFTVADVTSPSEYVELDVLNNITKVQVVGPEDWGLVQSDIVVKFEEGRK